MKNQFVLFVFAGVLALAGCRSFGPIDHYCSKDGLVVTQEDLRKHVIHVDRDGDFYEIPERDNGENQPIYKWAAADRIGKDLHEKQFEVMTNAYEKIFEGIDAYAATLGTNQLTLTLMLHGGLATPEKTLEKELEAVAAMKNDSGDSTYPIFINWRSGGLTTLNDHLFRIRDGEVFEYAKYTAIPVCLPAYLWKVVGDAPLAFLRSIRDNVKSFPFLSEVEKLREPPEGWSVSNRFHSPASDGYPCKWGESISYNLGYVSRVLFVPLTFSAGTPAWKGMKRRTHVELSREAAG